MNKAEKMVGEFSFKNAKNKSNAKKYLDRYSRMLRDKKLEREKEEAKDLKWN